MEEDNKLKEKLSAKELKLLTDIKKTVTKNTDAIVKLSKDGTYNVYKNKITKIS